MRNAQDIGHWYNDQSGFEVVPFLELLCLDKWRSSLARRAESRYASTSASPPISKGSSNATASANAKAANTAAAEAALPLPEPVARSTSSGKNTAVAAAQNGTSAAPKVSYYGL